MSGTLVMDGQEFAYFGGVDFSVHQDTLVDIIGETVVRARERLAEVVGLYNGISELMEHADAVTMVRLLAVFPNLAKMQSSPDVVLVAGLASTMVEVVA